MLVCLTACSAPQGKKIAKNDGGLAPVATGPSGSPTLQMSDPALQMSSPALQMSTVTIANRGAIVGVHPTKTLTVTLPASNRDGYAWRLSEIPDPSVLKLVSQNYTPGADWTKPGEQSLVFEATGTGDVPVKMWYGTLWASRMEETKPFEFIASVTPEEKKVEKKPAKKSSKKSKTSKIAKEEA